MRGRFLGTIEGLVRRADIRGEGTLHGSPLRRLDGPVRIQTAVWRKAGQALGCFHGSAVRIADRFVIARKEAA
jgi:hypothetical protein